MQINKINRRRNSQDKRSFRTPVSPSVRVGLGGSPPEVREFSKLLLPDEAALDGLKAKVIGESRVLPEVRLRGIPSCLGRTFEGKSGGDFTSSSTPRENTRRLGEPV